MRGCRHLVVLALAHAVAFASAERDTEDVLTRDIHDAALVRANTSIAINTVQDLDDAVLQHIGTFSRDPKNIANFHLKAQETIMAAVKMFSSLGDVNKKPDITGGISKMGGGLFACMEVLLPDNVKNADYYPQFRDAWTQVFTDLPKVEGDIEKHVNAYAQDAKPEELASVVRLCVKAGLATARRFLPEESYNKVEKYFNGIEGTMNGVVCGWQAFSKGKTENAVECVYDGLNSALTIVLPDNVKNNEAVKVMMETMDKQIGQINEHVLKFKRQLQESSICYRSTHKRKRKHADKCGAPGNEWAGWKYSGNGICRKSGSLLEVSDEEVSDEEESVDAVLGKKKKKKQLNPNTERNAICDPNSDYKDHIGKFCYKNCPNGFTTKGKKGKHCQTRCAGNKAFGSTELFGRAGEGKFCGKSPQMIQMVVMEMFTAVVSGFLKLFSIVQSLLTKGKVGSDALTSTVDTLIALGVPFANPKCPTVLG